MNFLKVRIDQITLKEAQTKVFDFLNNTKQRKIFTPNPEFLVRAQKDKFFKDILNTSDLNLCDGFGISLFTGIKRITGVDFMQEICKIAEKSNKKVFLLGSGSEKVLNKTKENLLKKFPDLKIVGMDTGPKITDDLFLLKKANCEECSGRAWLNIDKNENESLINKINNSNADILFVAFGMGKQEKWIYENLSRLHSIKIAMGVGGSFDYISGAVKRAPCFMRKIGIEWIYRLFKEPERFWRVVNATIIFVFLAIKEKIF